MARSHGHTSQGTGKKATQARYKTHIDTFVAWLGDRADAKLEIITKADIRKYREDTR